jgi:hypothetical protein
MLTKKTITLVVLGMVVIFNLILLQEKTGLLAGKKYNPARDFACCKDDQLHLFHYYEFQICGAKISDSFEDEKIGKPIKNGCNILCNE